MLRMRFRHTAADQVVCSFCLSAKWLCTNPDAIGDAVLWAGLGFCQQKPVSARHEI